MIQRVIFRIFYTRPLLFAHVGKYVVGTVENRREGLFQPSPLLRRSCTWLKKQQDSFLTGIPYMEGLKLTQICLLSAKRGCTKLSKQRGLRELISMYLLVSKEFLQFRALVPSSPLTSLGYHHQFTKQISSNFILY